MVTTCMEGSCSRNKTLARCFSNVPPCCGKISNKNNKGRVYLGSEFEGSAHHGGEGMGTEARQLLLFCHQETRRCALLFSCLFVFMQPHSLVHGLVLHTFRVGLTSLVNSTQECPHRQAQRRGFLDPVKQTMQIITYGESLISHL